MAFATNFRVRGSLCFGLMLVSLLLAGESFINPIDAEFKPVLVSDVVSSIGGRDVGTGIVAEFTVGQTAVGVASGHGFVELAGFWHRGEFPTQIEVEPKAGISSPEFDLTQNYPNPFNPRTTISFSIPGHNDTSSLAALRVFNASGQLVRCLVNSYVAPGTYKADWDGRDDQGNEVSCGVYFYRLDAGRSSATRRFVLVK